MWYKHPGAGISTLVSARPTTYTIAPQSNQTLGAV